jgi:hypothetical protein
VQLDGLTGKYVNVDCAKAVKAVVTKIAKNKIKGNVMNWINGFDAGNKKEKYYLEFRVGTFTVLELKWEKDKFRFMIFNLGFEI